MRESASAGSKGDGKRQKALDKGAGLGEALQALQVSSTSLQVRGGRGYQMLWRPPRWSRWPRVVSRDLVQRVRTTETPQFTFLMS